MSIRNLDVLFKPRSIALIGASKARASMGAVLAHNLFNSGFTGPIMPVDPKHRAIEGVLTYPDAAALPEVPDLAVIATPPDTVPRLIDEFGERGTRAAVVITAGFGEGGDVAGGGLRQAMLEAARRYTLRIIGPNCIGVMVPHPFLHTTSIALSCHAPRLRHRGFWPAAARSPSAVSTAATAPVARAVHESGGRCSASQLIE